MEDMVRTDAEASTARNVRRADGRGAQPSYDADETSLAAATAALITSRWNAASRRAVSAHHGPSGRPATGLDDTAAEWTPPKWEASNRNGSGQPPGYNPAAEYGWNDGPGYGNGHAPEYGHDAPTDGRGDVSAYGSNDAPTDGGGEVPAYGRQTLGYDNGHASPYGHEEAAPRGGYGAPAVTTPPGGSSMFTAAPPPAVPEAMSALAGAAATGATFAASAVPDLAVAPPAVAVPVETQPFVPKTYPPDLYPPGPYPPGPNPQGAYAADTHTPDMYAPEAYAPQGYAPDRHVPQMYPMETEPGSYDPAYGSEGYGSIGLGTARPAVDEGVRPSLGGFQPPPEPSPFEPPSFVPWIDTNEDETGFAPPAGGRQDVLLPQRVPARPDVPDVPLSPNDPLRDPASSPVADGQELSRIATYLRHDRDAGLDSRPHGFDLTAVIAAVRSVPDVRDAQLRWNSNSGHTLRIDLVDGADAGRVTREVARLLRETMGLAAEPNEPSLPGERPGPPRQRQAPTAGTATVPGGFDAPTGRPFGADRSSSTDRGAHPLAAPLRRDGTPNEVARVVLDHVQVTTLGVDAMVQVRLSLASGARAVGNGQGPAVDGFLLRLAGTAATDAVDQLLAEAAGSSRQRCYLEHVAVVPLAGSEVALVVVVLVHGGHAEQLSGSAILAGDPCHAVVRATLSAVNRRLESLLA